jgi:hypothetical protein
MRGASFVLILLALSGSSAVASHRTNRTKANRRPRLAVAEARAPAVALQTAIEPASAPLAPAPEPAVVPSLAEPVPSPTPLPVPAPRSTHRYPLLAPGLVFFLAGYGLDVGVSFGLGHDRAALSLIPIVGPLVQLGDSWAVAKPAATGNAQLDQMANERIAQINRTVQTAAYVVLSVDALLQAAGIALVIAGVVPHRPARDLRARPQVAWSVTPALPGARLSLTF